jgi:EAL domain-containing protein (putative c-di-GMP-specific phosphodiesterase class I)
MLVQAVVEARVQSDELTSDAETAPRSYSLEETRIESQPRSDLSSSAKLISLDEYIFGAVNSTEATEMARLEVANLTRALLEQHQSPRFELARQLIADASLRANLFITYQPVVDAVTGQVRSADTHVRGWDPHAGLEVRDAWISAEIAVRVTEVAAYVLCQVCEDAVKWSAVGEHAPSVSVGVSAAQIESGKLVDQVDEALRVSGLSPNRLFVELTEETLDSRPEAYEMFATLKRRGVSISIANFGTGHTSLSNLRRFPLDRLKIGKLFIDGLGEAGDGDDAKITESVIALAHALNLTVVADGVKNEQQASTLLRQGCDMFQGPLISKPRSSADFEAWLAAHTVGLANL